MEVLGIGPLEFLLIVLVAIIILGPKDMQRVGKTVGRALNKWIKSDTWKTVRQASDKIMTLPNELMRNAEMEEFLKTSEKTEPEANKIAPPPPPSDQDPPQ
jgi:Sec-independent protein translocase protein TatA